MSLPDWPPVPSLPDAAAATPVRTAIARAAAATHVDFGYLLGQARLESGLDPQARARTSSATGLYQFTRSAWLDALARHGADIGLDPAVLRNPAQSGDLLALRADPGMAALMAAHLASDNRDALAAALGREPDSAELYLAHFLGADGATRFLAALTDNPGQSAAALFPRAAEANRAIFYDGDAARPVGAVMALLRARLDTAMNPGSIAPPGGADLPVPAAPDPRGPLAREFAGLSAPQRTSMADVLAATFSASDGPAMPATVRAAYGQLRALGV